MSLVGEGADFIQALPGVFFALKPLDPLRLGFFDLGVHRPPLAAKRKTHESDQDLTRGLEINLL